MTSIRHRALLGVGLVLLPASAWSQAAKPATARAVWEPVSYSEDLTLTDAFFVTPDVGWVSGDKGTILHTKDGGSSWTPQLGGDPASPDPKIDRLRFYDERHGWAVQGRNKLLRTTDGEAWEEAGALPTAFTDYQFVSPVDGFASATPSSQGNHDHIFRTRDGGGSWEVVASCKVKVVVEGTNRELSCTVERIVFPSRNVGYAIGSQFWFNTQRWPPIIGKTVDGGETWEFFVGPGNPKEAQLEDLAFTDELNGVVYAHGEVGLQKLYSTSDGAKTWKSVVASPGSYPRFYFADPEVGWSISTNKLLYTTNGGKKWTAVAQQFPSYQIGVSFPRRDRAYVVGDHGLVLRYRVLAQGEKIVAAAKTAPVMPAYATTLEEEATTVVEALEALQGTTGTAGGPIATGPEAADEESAEEYSEAASEEPAAAAAPLTVPAFAPAKLGKLDVLITALGSTVPSFLDQFTNLNLLAARLRSVGELPARLSELKAAIAAVKQAPDNSTAQAALAQALGAAQGLHSAARVAVQKQLPAASPVASTGAASVAADGESGEDVAQSEEPAQEEVEEEVEEETEE